MKQFYAYIYRDPSRNGEAIYVGKGKANRAYKHLTRKDMHPFTQRLQKMKREGVEPDIKIIHCYNEEVAFAAEVLSIKVLGRKDLGKGSLLNLTDGGEGASGCIPSAETRKKKSDAMKGENHPMYGKSHSAEARRKISDAQKGKSFSSETRRKISATSKGRLHSTETCQKLSEANKGENNPNYGKSHSPETRQKMSDAKKNMTPETRQKMSEAQKGKVQPKSICPHCGKLSAPSRWHFDNCKYKK